MLQLGNQLYTLNVRDQQNQRLEPYFREANIALPIGGAGTQIVLNWDRERILYLHSMVLNLDGGAAASRWLGPFIKLEQAPNLTGGASSICDLWYANNGTTGVVGDGAIAPSQIYTKTIHFGLILPKFTRLVVNVQRTDTTALGTASVDIHGYLIPAGQVGIAL